ncbi:MAG: DUF1738 domain-containing protein [Alphaproteobacteria bacterium]|nr:DUF1738 domain-containing protein [Alphaproteobacteria bacterium]
MKNKIYQTVTKQIINQLEQVNLGDYNKPWFCVGHSPINLRGTTYRGINHVLLSNSGYVSNIWATFKQWSDHGCKVKKGEKSQLVVLWKFFAETDEEGERTGKTKSVMIKYFRVFNSCQVEGDYARKSEQRFKDKLKDHNSIAKAEQFIQSYKNGEQLETRLSDRAYYSSGTSEFIGMPEIGQFKSPEHYYSVFAHEIAHSTGSKDRLNRAMSGRFGSTAYAFEELVAELGSAMICGSLGLESKPREDHAQYIKGWLSALRGDDSFIICAASHAQKAADYALRHMEEPAVMKLAAE